MNDKIKIYQLIDLYVPYCIIIRTYRGAVVHHCQVVMDCGSRQFDVPRWWGRKSLIRPANSEPTLPDPTQKRSANGPPMALPRRTTSGIGDPLNLFTQRGLGNVEEVPFFFGGPRETHCRAQAAEANHIDRTGRIGGPDGRSRVGLRRPRIRSGGAGPQLAEIGMLCSDLPAIQRSEQSGIHINDLPGVFDYFFLFFFISGVKRSCVCANLRSAPHTLVRTHK